VLAERCGLRIHEVPVDWYDDPDSRVDVLHTAVDDLHGIVRLRRALAAGRLPIPAVRERIGRHPAEAGVMGQVWRFAGVGLVSTALHLGLFAWLAAALPSAQTANLLALLVATVANTAANRRWTFGLRGRQGLGRQHLQALTVFGLTWAMSSLALLLVGSITASPGATLQTAAIAVANVAATAVRFVAMRQWIFNDDNTPAVIATGPAPEHVVRRPGSEQRQSA
jgi:putative flippase GtrA